MSQKGLLSAWVFFLILPCSIAKPIEYRPKMEDVNGRPNPTIEVIQEALNYPPESAIPFLQSVLVHGTPQASELARTTLISYPGWQAYFDTKLSEAVEVWKTDKIERMFRDIAGNVHGVLIDGDNGGIARRTAERIFRTLAATKHPAAVPIIAKRLNADGIRYFDGDEDCIPLNWTAAESLIRLARSGVIIPGAPTVESDWNVILSQWKGWWQESCR